MSAYSPRINPDARLHHALAPATLTLLALLVAGCVATLPTHDPGGRISPAILLRGEPITGATDAVPLPDIDVLGLDDAMRNFLADNVNMKSPHNARLHQLLEAVISKGGLGIEYNERTYTAAEAFRSRQANCLSFTNLFIALGREVGLKLSYQEVDIPPDWSQSGDTLVLNRHINTFVKTDYAREQVVDFNMADFRSSYDRRVISDTRAMAHFYSNLGADSLQGNDRVGALSHFRKAISADSGFTPAWINLGVLYLRAGYPDWARSAWLHALELTPGDQVAMSNLERLYRQQGEIGLADSLDSRIERYRMQNPYYRYHLAREAFDLQDYDTAITHLKFAVRQKKTEDRFFALLGLSYLRRGDPEAARVWITRAEEAAGNSELRSGYHSKLELLQRANRG